MWDARCRILISPGWPLALVAFFQNAGGETKNRRLRT